MPIYIYTNSCFFNEIENNGTAFCPPPFWGYCLKAGLVMGCDGTMEAKTVNSNHHNGP